MPAAARFAIGDKIYTTAALDEISLKDLLTWQAEVSALGIKAAWSEIEAAAYAMAEAGPDATPDELIGNVDTLLMLAVTIWASRRAAGEDIRFGDAVDIKMKDLHFLEPEDDKTPAGPTKRPAKKSAKGSGRAAGPAAGK